MRKLKPYAKAIVAGGAAFFGSLATAASDDVVTSSEWALIASTTFAALYGVFRTPWMPAEDEPAAG